MESFSVPVSLLRQYCFCPRIPYFQLMIGLQPSGPMWLKQGLDHHAREEMLLKRRKLDQFGVSSRNFRFLQDVGLFDAALGLHGICDGVILTDDEVVPLEFKLSESTPPLGARLQLTAYAMLLESQEERPVRRGFILYGRKGRSLEVAADEKLRTAVMTTADQIRRACGRAVLPHSAATESQCAQCEYQNFCADRF